MEKCWQENPDFRPNFENIRKDLLALIEKEVIIKICFKNASLTQFFCVFNVYCLLSSKKR